MKLLLIASFAESIVPFRGALIRSLVEQGTEVIVAAPGLELESSSAKEIEAIGATAVEIPLERTGTNPVCDLVLSWHLFRLMRRIKPDIVLGYTIKPVIYGSLVAWLAKVPRRFVLVTGLGYAFTGPRSGPLAFAAKWLYRRAFERVHKVFLQNPDDLALLRQQNLLPDRIPTVVVNGSGIDLSEFKVEPLPVGSVNFLMIGRLLNNKGVREYAQASQQVKLRHPNVRCRLVGWVDDNPDAIARAELDSWVEDGIVEYLGRLQDVRPAIANCSVYVLPSYREGTPRTVLEAMAIGRAIITTDAPGCRETVVDGKNGILVPVGSVAQLADAMCRFVVDSELAKTMGRHSREIAEAKYDVRKVNAVMLHEMGNPN